MLMSMPQARHHENQCALVPSMHLTIFLAIFCGQTTCLEETQAVIGWNNEAKSNNQDVPFHIQGWALGSDCQGGGCVTKLAFEVGNVQLLVNFLFSALLM